MTRKISILCLILCTAAIGGALYLEYEYMLAVCPLCILQRIIFYALIPILLLGAILKPKAFIGKIYSCMVGLVSLTGVLLAGRQTWLQYFAPPQQISCSASLERLIAIHPFFDAIKIAIVGSGECSEIDFAIFGLSLAVWSLLLFSALFAASIFLFRESSK